MNRVKPRPLIARFALSCALAVLSVSAAAATSDDLEAQLQAALQRLDAQEAELAAQREMLLEMRAELGKRDASNDGEVATQPATAVISSSLPVAEAPPALTLTQPALTATERETAIQVAAADAQTDDPTRDLIADFNGAIRIPDSDAALRIGGFVKTDAIYNYDALTVPDRFIVGSIPTSDSPPSTVKTQSQITANQSRLNVDLRQPTREGILRAFVEGDFQGSGNTFRMRHAFGQWKRLLAGQTWSAFMDTSASPEEIDFEGLNGRINARQPQIRISPNLSEVGRRHEFVLSIEDPDVKVTNGDGLSQVPDIVASARFNWADNMHYQIAVVLRQIRAEWLTDPMRTEEEFGWGVSVSGRIELPNWGAKDQIVFQVNGGRGIGRYINDLNTIGDYDGIFSPTGQLDLIDVYAGYVSGQHWWNGTMRSNLTFGYVQISSPDYVLGPFYERTYRASVNLMWTPTPRIDMGWEFLWGERENIDGSSGTAKQIQVAAQYQF